MCEHVVPNREFSGNFPFLYYICGRYSTVKICPGHSTAPVEMFGCAYRSGNYICGHQTIPGETTCPAHACPLAVYNYFKITVLSDILIAVIVTLFATVSAVYLGLLVPWIIVELARFYLAYKCPIHTPRFCYYVHEDNGGRQMRCLHQLTSVDQVYCHIHEGTAGKRPRCIAPEHDDRFSNEEGNPQEQVCGNRPERDGYLCDYHDNMHTQNNTHYMLASSSPEIFRIGFLVATFLTAYGRDPLVIFTVFMSIVIEGMIIIAHIGWSITHSACTLKCRH